MPPPGSALFGTSIRTVPYSPCQTLPPTRRVRSLRRLSSKLLAKAAKAENVSVLKSDARVKFTPAAGTPPVPAIPEFRIIPTSFALITILCVSLSAMRSNSTFMSSCGRARRDAGSPKSVYCSVPGIQSMFRIRLRKLILASATIYPIVGCKGALLVPANSGDS